MASWKKVLTEGDDTNLGSTDLTQANLSTRTYTIDPDGDGAGQTVLKFQYGSPAKSLLTMTTVNNLASIMEFAANTFTVRSVIQCVGTTDASSGRASFYEAADNGIDTISLAAPTSITGGATIYTLPERPTSANSLLVSGAASSVSTLTWANELNWDSSDKELELNGALTKPLGAASGRSGNLLDVTEVDDASGKCIGDFVNLDGLSSATFATNRVFAFSGAGAPLADADNESDATRMLLFNNIVQSSSSTLKALRKGMAIIPEADVEGTAAAGAIMYLHPSGGTSANEGKMTFTRPTASGKFVRHVGYCIKTVTISAVDYVVFLFDPSSDFIKLA